MKIKQIKRRVNEVINDLDEAVMYGLLKGQWSTDPRESVLGQENERQVRAALYKLMIDALEMNGHELERDEE